MAAIRARNVYRQTQINTANPAQLAALLCAGAVKFIDQAQQAMEAGRVENTHNHLVKAQACVTELRASLNYELGGELAAQLGALYDYATRRLTAANVRKDPAALLEARKVLSQLREAWSGITTAPNPVPGGANLPGPVDP